MHEDFSSIGIEVVSIARLKDKLEESSARIT